MKRPVLQNSQVEIVKSGRFYTVLLGKHISLTWDKGTSLLVHISATYRVLIHYNTLFAWLDLIFYYNIVYVKYIHCVAYIVLCVGEGVRPVW